MPMYGLSLTHSFLIRTEYKINLYIGIFYAATIYYGILCKPVMLYFMDEFMLF